MPARANQQKIDSPSCTFEVACTSLNTRIVPNRGAMHAVFVAKGLQNSCITHCIALSKTRVWGSRQKSAACTWSSTSLSSTPHWGWTICSYEIAAERLVGHYYPYGQEKGSGNPASGEKFTGYNRDPETLLDYAHARYHSPGTGRFLTPDPSFGFSPSAASATTPGSWNKYAYGSGDPVGTIDPAGRMGLTAEYCNANWDDEDCYDGDNQFCDDGTMRYVPAGMGPCYQQGGGGGGYKPPAPKPTCADFAGPISDPTIVERLMNENSYGYLGDVPSLFAEDLWIMSAINNRVTTVGYNKVQDSNGNAVPNTLHNQALYANGPGRPTDMGPGIALYTAALTSEPGSGICDDLIMAVDAMNSVMAYGSVDTGVLNWYGKGTPPAFYPAPINQINMTTFYGYITFPKAPRKPKK
jgi:RHS repeat-associated protein